MRKVCRLNLWENLFCSNFLSQGESVHLFIIASAMIKRTRANSPPIAVQRTSAHFLSFSRLGGMVPLTGSSSKLVSFCSNIL